MAENRLTALAKLGQSIWYDQMQRSLVTEGKLAKMIEEDDLRGLTSNPTIFEKAIAGTREYDEQLRELARERATRDDIYDAIVIRDISSAADVFRPVYDRTHGSDGFVSLEVGPLAAHDTEETIRQAKKYWAAVNRPNLMVKIPATVEGIPAIEECIAAGLNINITLIFARSVYAQVIEAYIKGLERRAVAGLPIDNIASVASFFVSRIDTKADKALDEKIKQAKDDGEKKRLASLKAKVAIANAKLAYQLFKEQFGSARFQKLAKLGAKVQRPLWASTGTKNPAYSDVLYLDELIGVDTVNTVPPQTYLAFKDHGVPKLTIESDLEGAKQMLELFEKEGISLDRITDELTSEGVKSFSESFESLLSTIDARRAVVVRQVSGKDITDLGSYQKPVDDAIAKIDKDKSVSRIWKKEPAVWKSDEAHAKIISNALGWLDVVGWSRDRAKELKEFANSARKDFDHVVVLGMGGSSLCSEVLRQSFGKVDGYPTLHVLDSTVPEAVRALEEKIDVARTIFIVASKSGTTTEPRVFHHYFFDRVKQKKGARAGENFVAITDPSTELAREAERDGFRKVFTNPADIGGRYSALSLFGMVPAALCGIDVERFLDFAMNGVEACSPVIHADENPGVALGAAMGVLAQQGRDKLTIFTSPTFAALGLWIEQLIAESTGKEGKGILPIALEPVGSPEMYGDDRVFVYIRDAESEDAELRGALAKLRTAGHPFIEHLLDGPYDLGDEFFVWEFATAIAGSVLGIDAFDQPNVQESKDNTKRLLQEFESKGTLPVSKPLAEENGMRVAAASAVSGSSLDGILAALLGSVKKGDYIALMEFVAQSDASDAAIVALRKDLMRTLRVATTSGYGPRFLHSTGQLHKGGADNGVFIQFSAEAATDVAVPGEKFTFGTLVHAQAIGDFQSLASRKRRAISIDLGKDAAKGLQRVAEAVSRALAAVTK